MFKCGCFLAGLILLTALSGQGQTLFTYGKYPVSSKEFLRAFEKNPPAGNRKKALEEYLPLYIAYKLKVRHAYDTRMDTLPGQKAELENYRLQLEESVLREKSSTAKLVEEALERSQWDILLGHLFIRFDPADSASEKQAEKQAALALQQLKSGKAFGQVVSAFSTDADQKAAGGKVGWITAFSLPYVYENAIYALKDGGFSSPIRGSDGYHIFYKWAGRPAVGKVKLAQIMLWLTPGISPAEKAAKKRLADSLYNLLKAGAQFADLALQYSNDRTSYATGGQLPEFGVGQYEARFEEAAFALENPGQISEPFETSYGYHILKLERRIKPPGAGGDAEALSALNAAVFNDRRADLRREEFLRKQLPKMGYSQFKYPEALLWTYSDSVRFDRPNPVIPGLSTATPLFILGGKKQTVKDWGNYLAMARAGGTQKGNYAALMDKFVLQKAEESYRANLAKYEPRFAGQLSEFKDANLLFEAMEKNVWAKASADEEKLNKYYEEHKAGYKWGPGAFTLMVSGSDSAMVEDMRMQMSKEPKQWRTASEKYAGALMADSARLETEQLPLPAHIVASKGYLSPTTRNSVDHSFSFAYIFDLAPGGDQRSFNDARGFVMNDYQALLEKQWLDGLRKKYPVKVNDTEWKKLLSSK